VRPGHFIVAGVKITAHLFALPSVCYSDKARLLMTEVSAGMTGWS